MTRRSYPITKFTVLLLALLATHAICGESSEEFSPEFRRDFEAGNCTMNTDKPEILNGVGAAVCFARVTCSSSVTGKKYGRAVTTGAFDNTSCPPLRDWIKRADWLRSQEAFVTERPKFDEPVEAAKKAHSDAIGVIQKVEGSLNCAFSTTMLSVHWVKQADGEMKPFCSGALQCMEKDARGKWVTPAKTPPAILGCSPRTKENLRFGEIYCKESVAECWKERADFPTMPDAPMREDYKWNTLTGKESDAGQFVSRDRTLANPDVGDKEVHDGRPADRKPQSEPRPVGESLVLGRVR